MWCLIVSIPDLCSLSYFASMNSNVRKTKTMILLPVFIITNSSIVSMYRRCGFILADCVPVNIVLHLVFASDHVTRFHGSSGVTSL